MADNTTPRPEYPRPDLMRSDWLNLNGTWRFAFDDEDRGLRARWHEDPSALDREILVPFPYQSPMSGIGTRDLHPVVWYARRFQVPAEWAGRRVLLHFGAVDYQAQVWVNGVPAAGNTGGHVPFSADVTDLLAAGENVLVVRVEDREDPSQPRGKQSVRYESWGCYYTRTTGIWQTVWLEPVPEFRVASLRLLPDIHRAVFGGGATPPRRPAGARIRAVVSLTGAEVAVAETEIPPPAGPIGQHGPYPGTLWLEVPVAQPLLWSPENPDLYDLSVELLEDGHPVDRVESYFGMREVSVKEGRFLLNGEPYVCKMVLDQGFWPEGLYTPPSDGAIRTDVEMTKAFGFNGARKHQKVEDPRYYYWADRLGLLVWGEMANTGAYTPEAIAALAAEWQRAIRRDWNHPCIVAWVPINESWGVYVTELQSDLRQVEFLRAMFRLTKALDDTRPVVDNDGYDHTETDIVALHDYSQDPAEMMRRSTSLFRGEPEQPYPPHLTFLPGFAYRGQPVMVTEYGGIGLLPEEARKQGAWGYGRSAGSPEELVERFAALTQALLADDRIAGYCYTQLTDVEQEMNGLLTYDRKPKVDPERVAEAQAGSGK